MTDDVLSPELEATLDERGSAGAQAPQRRDPLA
jgi:hypothetical protein